MEDTSPDIAEKVREMFQQKSPEERIKMGFSMHETSRYLVASSIWKETPIYSGADLRRELFLKFYGSDFDPVARQQIIDHFGPRSIQQDQAMQEEDLLDFKHIPEMEKSKDWWRLLQPLIQARLRRDNPENSRLLMTLRNIEGPRTWLNIKSLIEIALVNVKNGKRILARTAEIRGSPNPDGIVDDLFGELRTIPYLLLKGFKNLVYSRRDGLDFSAEWNGKTIHIESTYVHGPDFKTQEYLYAPNEEYLSPIYRILPDKLIALFERIYANKKEQVMRYGVNHPLILMITDLEETYAPWLDHAATENVHPILKLVTNWDIPTVIFGAGSVYEPPLNSLGGIFGELNPFDWKLFAATLEKETA